MAASGNAVWQVANIDDPHGQVSDVDDLNGLLV